MSARISLCWHALGGVAVVLAFAGPARSDDPATVKQLQDAVAKLEKKVVDLEAKVSALEKQGKVDPGAKPDKNEEEYAKTMAGAMLDALLAGDAAGMKNKMTKNLDQGIESFFKTGFNHDDVVEKWIKDWNKEKKYQSHTIDKVVMAPNKEEILVTGTLSGKEVVNAAFTMTLMKSDKKLLLEAVSVKSK